MNEKLDGTLNEQREAVAFTGHMRDIYYDVQLEIYGEGKDRQVGMNEVAMKDFMYWYTRR